MSLRVECVARRTQYNILEASGAWLARYGGGARRYAFKGRGLGAGEKGNRSCVRGKCVTGVYSLRSPSHFPLNSCTRPFSPSTMPSPPTPLTSPCPTQPPTPTSLRPGLTSGYKRFLLPRLGGRLGSGEIFLVNRW